MLGIRWTCGALALLGTPFTVLCSLVVYIAVSGVFTLDNQISWIQKIFGIVVAAWAISGFYVWHGWIRFAAKGRFVQADGPTFMTISAAHHLGWLILLPLGTDGGILSRSAPITLWLALNCVLALFLAIPLTSLEAKSPDVTDPCGNPLQKNNPDKTL